MTTDSPDWQEVVTLISGGAVTDSPDWQRTVTGPGAAPIGGGTPTVVTDIITQSVSSDGYNTIANVELDPGTWLINAFALASYLDEGNNNAAAFLASFPGQPDPGLMALVHAYAQSAFFTASGTDFVTLNMSVALAGWTGGSLYLSAAGNAALWNATYEVGDLIYPACTGIVAIGWT